MSVLKLEGVSKTLGGRQIVRDLTMTVHPGEIYGFLGPNGAGKTTTIRMIVGLVRPSSGRIEINGHDVQTDRTHALQHVGAIVENPETYKYLTGRQNLIHYARLAGIENIPQRIEEVNAIVGLNDRLDDKVKRYSLGMRQRLGVAQALLAQPKLLVLDEPTNGLDPAGMKEFRELMRSLAAEGMAVFVSSHLLGELEQMCDRVGILNGGRVVIEQRMADLLRQASGGMSIRTNNNAVGMQALKAAGFDCTSHSDDIRLNTVESTVVAQAVRVLVAANLDVYAVESPRDTLEDTFLELTDGRNSPFGQGGSSTVGEVIAVGGAGHA